MSNSSPDPLQADIPEADILEQRRSATWDESDDAGRGETPPEANEADVAEQYLDVANDDDEYPHDG